MSEAIQTASVRKQKNNAGVAKVAKIPLPRKRLSPQQHIKRISRKRGVGMTIADATSSLVRIFKNMPEEIPKMAQMSDPLGLDLVLLKERRDQFQNLYENAPIGDFSVTLGGKISMANKFACELLGYKQDELIGLSVLDIYADTPQGKKRAQQLNKHIMAGNEIANEKLEMRRADGTSVWVDLTVRLIRNAEGEPVGRRGLVIDITERKKSEERLQTLKNKYKDLWESAPIAYYRVGIDGYIKMANKTAQTMTGYSEKELKKKKIIQLYSKESQIKAKQLFEKFKKGHGLENEEMTQVRKDGKEISILISVNPIKDHGGNVIANRSAVVDITEKKTVESALQESENKYYNLFTNANDAIFIIDPVHDEIFDVNPKACSMLKYSRKRLLSLTVSAIHPREMPEFRAFAQSVLRDGSGWTNELTCLTKNGKMLPVEMSASVINVAGNSYMLALVRDITERKQAEEKLKNYTHELERTKWRLEYAKAKNEATLSSIGDGVIATDASGKIMMINKATEDMLGWKNGKVIGKHTYDVFPLFEGEGKDQIFVPPEKRPESIARASGKKIFTDVVSSSRSCSFMRKDGKQLQVAITAAPVFLKKEKIGVIETFRDVSKELEVDRAKSEFVSLASHQLRTPPTIISLYSELLFADKENQLNKKQLQSLKEIDNANHRMTELINAILNVSRIELGTLKVNLQSIRLTNLVDTLLQEISSKIEKRGLFIKKRYGSTMPSVKVDPVLISMALQNLLLNAIEYTPKRGKIQIVIKKQKNDIMFAISDTGCGIPKGQQGEIFTKLFRADNAQKVKAHGTGLGLYITKSIVEKMGGKIWFESAFNKGSTFYVLLPVKSYKVVRVLGI